MKVVIPVAGVGLHLRPHTHTQPKPLVPVAGKPILGHIVDTFIKAGITDFVFVIGYLGDRIEDYIKTTYADKIKAEFVLQEPREGSAHAIWTARKFIENENEVIITLGDTIINMNYQKLLDCKFSVVGVSKVSNPRHFGIAETNEEFFVSKLIEKPLIPKSNLALIGVYKILNIPLLLSSIESVINENQKTNGEYQLTDALMKMIEAGELIGTLMVDKWYDCGKKENLLAANAILLKNPNYSTFPETKYTQTNIIIEPVHLGQDCEIENSIIGPNVAIGNNTIIKHSIIKDTIIGSFSELTDVILTHSIVGSDAGLKGLQQSLNIGDSTEINFKS